MVIGEKVLTMLSLITTLRLNGLAKVVRYHTSVLQEQCCFDISDMMMTYDSGIPTAMSCHARRLSTECMMPKT